MLCSVSNLSSNSTRKDNRERPLDLHGQFGASLSSLLRLHPTEKKRNKNDCIHFFFAINPSLIIKKNIYFLEKYTTYFYTVCHRIWLAYFGISYWFRAWVSLGPLKYVPYKSVQKINCSTFSKIEPRSSVDSIFPTLRGRDAEIGSQWLISLNIALT